MKITATIHLIVSFSSPVAWLHGLKKKQPLPIAEDFIVLMIVKCITLILGHIEVMFFKSISNGNEEQQTVQSLNLFDLHHKLELVCVSKITHASPISAE